MGTWPCPQVLDPYMPHNGTFAAMSTEPRLSSGQIVNPARTHMIPADVLKLIKEKEAKFADLRFTDTLGKEHHVTIPTRLVDEGFFKDGKMFDGSSIAGWKGINHSGRICLLEPA